MNALYIAILATVLSFAAASVGRAELTVQVVNDSGLPDSQVYILLTGKPLTTQSGTIPINVSGIAVANSTGGFVNNPPVNSQAVSTVTVGVPFNPLPDKAISKVVFPGKGARRVR